MVDIVITSIWFSGPKSRSANIFVLAGGYATIGRPGGLQADLLGGLGGEAPNEKGKLHVACECRHTHV